MPPRTGAGAGAAASASAGSNSTTGTRRGGYGGQQPATTANLKRTAPAPAAVHSDRNKVVVRRCPPELPESVFWQSVEPWIKDDAADWKLYKQGRTRVHGSNKESINSVAYIHFKRQDQVTTFAAAYQGHTFRDGKGNRFQVIVQYAPFQKIPPKKIKSDQLSGTIDDDADYQAFVKSLSEPDEPQESRLPEPSTAASKGVKKTTPLLDALRKRKHENALRKLDVAKSARKKVDGPQSRSAKRAAARAAAAGGVGGSTSSAAITGGKGKETAAATDKTTSKEKEKGGKAVRVKAKKAGKSDSLPTAPIANGQPKAVQVNAQKPGQKAGIVGGLKQEVKALQKKTEVPKMTILAPPTKSSAEKTEPQLKLAGAGSTASPSSAGQAVQPPKPTPPVAAAKPKLLGSFDAIVGEFAKQMSKPAPKATSTSLSNSSKGKQAPASERAEPKGLASVGSASKASGTAASPVSPNGPKSPNSKPQDPKSPADAGRGRGRGAGPSQRGRRNASGSGRGAPAPTSAPATTAAPS